jgi:co-chaperonin GroES (HSP10)
MKTTILDTIVSGLPYRPRYDIIVKPLETIQVEKELVEKVDTGEFETDETTGMQAAKYETKTVTKTVDANFQEGIVIATPTTSDIKVGDCVVFGKNKGISFELFKDSVLLRDFDIVAFKPSGNESRGTEENLETI